MHDTDTTNTDERAYAQLPTITFPRGDSVDLGDTSILGADGDELINDVFSEEQQQRVKELDLDRYDILALALYAERRDDVSPEDAVTIAEDELKRRGREPPETPAEEHTGEDSEVTDR